MKKVKIKIYFRKKNLLNKLKMEKNKIYNNNINILIDKI